MWFAVSDTNSSNTPENASESNNERDVKPWDLLNPKAPRSPQDLKAERLAICHQCPKFSLKLQKCTLCGCFMQLKTELAKAKCPIGHW